MRALIAGATGATGKHLVDQLLSREHQVRVIVRSKDRIPEHWKNNDQVEVVEASILELSAEELKIAARDCQVIASCLGHPYDFRGTFLPPWRLLTHSARRLCEAAKANNPPEVVRFILLNSAANKAPDRGEKWGLGDRLLLSGLRLIVPTVLDIEMSASYLRTEIGQKDRTIEWVIVRPHTLVEEDAVGSYELRPTTDFSFLEASKDETSRINVGNFMARLADTDGLWHEWKGKMPVIGNR